MVDLSKIANKLSVLLVFLELWIESESKKWLDNKDYRIVDVGEDQTQKVQVVEAKPLSDYDAIDPFDKDITIQQNHVIKKRCILPFLLPALMGYISPFLFRRFTQPPVYYYYYYTYYDDYYSPLTRRVPRRIRVNSLYRPPNRRVQTQPIRKAPVKRQPLKTLPLERIPSSALETGTKRTYALTPPGEMPEPKHIRQFVVKKVPQRQKVLG